MGFAPVESGDEQEEDCRAKHDFGEEEKIACSGELDGAIGILNDKVRLAPGCLSRWRHFLSSPSFKRKSMPVRVRASLGRSGHLSKSLPARPWHAQSG